MRLLVTRPEQDAAPLKAQLIGLGHEVLVEPLLTVELMDIDPDDVDLQEAQALIATSRNAVRALARSPQATAAAGILLFAVGPGTASTAQALGFQHVLQGPSDAAALVDAIAEHAEVNAGPLVYLGGEVKAYDIGGELRRLGFHVQEPVVYRVSPAEALSGGIEARFAAGEIDGVILMSPHTARTYARLVKAHGLQDKSKGIIHFCLSQNVATALASLGEPRAVIAPQPNVNSLLAAIARGVFNLP